MKRVLLEEEAQQEGRRCLTVNLRGSRHCEVCSLVNNQASQCMKMFRDSQARSDNSLGKS